MQNASTEMVLDEQTLKDSKAFYAGYGDFALISSDGVRFHIHRSLLAHTSGFFKDLFSPSQVHQSGFEEAHGAFLLLKEPSITVEPLLRHIDPNETPDIEISTITAVLEAARFYRIPLIIRWFESEVVAVRRSKFRGEIEPCFMEKHPLLVLALAHKFGLMDLTQSAMRELITCDAELWDEDIDAAIDGRLVLYCRGLRDKRIELYVELVESLTQHELSNAKKIKDHNDETCMSCTVTRAKWTYSMLSSIIRRPEWSSFLAKYDEEIEPYSCPHENLWPDHKRKILQKWMNVNQPPRFERNLLSFPEWLQRQLLDNASLAP
jgi:BTB/POZ domain